MSFPITDESDLDVSSKLEFARDLVEALQRRPRQISPKYFYDKRGSELFDAICELPEYYPTRCEMEIMQVHGESIGEHLGREVQLVEYGSGSSLKTRRLLDVLEAPHRYVPVDISSEHLHQAAEALEGDYPHLEISPVAADFSSPFEVPNTSGTKARTVVYFPGSTIGNFEPAEALAILSQISSQIQDNGGLLIGVDLKKDVSTLENAYNDAAGVTAEFNLNLLHRVNRELDGDIEVDAFEHVALYNADAGRIEMYLESQSDQEWMVDGKTWEISAGERICTEYSHKYSIDEFCELAGKAGLSLERSWTDSENYFAVLHFCPATARRRAK